MGPQSSSSNGLETSLEISSAAGSAPGLKRLTSASNLLCRCLGLAVLLIRTVGGEALATNVIGVLTAGAEGSDEPDDEDDELAAGGGGPGGAEKTGTCEGAGTCVCLTSSMVLVLLFSKSEVLRLNLFLNQDHVVARQVGRVSVCYELEQVQVDPHVCSASQPTQIL